MVFWVFVACALACELPSLPPSLSFFSPSFASEDILEASGRFLSSSKTYSFEIQVESLIRFTAEPKRHTLEVSLTKGPSSIFLVSSPNFGQASFSGKLNPGTYELKFVIEEVISSNTNNIIDCELPNMYVNIGIVPYEKISKYKSQNFENAIPDFSDLSESLEYFLPFARTYPSISITPEMLNKPVLFSYPIKIDRIAKENVEFGYSGLWELTFSIHHEFIPVGGIGILFTKGNISTPKKFKCDDGSCLLGRHDQKNTVTLHSVFTEGQFLITAFYEANELEKELILDLEGFDITIHISLNPIYSREDRFNCDAGRLPHDLNLLIDSFGFLRYSDMIFADFAMKKQVTEVTIEKDSVIRVTSVEPSGVDVDLKIVDKNNKVIGQSNAVGGAEGILLEIAPGDYTIEVAFINSFIEDTRHKFCETVLLEIGISPQSAVTALSQFYELQTCKSSLQDLMDLFKDIKTTLESTNLQINPGNKYYRLAIESISQSEAEILKAPFTVPSLVYSYFEIYSDFIIGDLTIFLEKKVGNEIIKGTNNALEIGEHGRRSFQGELEPGDYYFIIRTGPLSKVVKDTEGKIERGNKDTDFKTIPKCVPFQLKIQFLLITEKSLENWPCKGVDLKLFPNTLNTIDKLGVKNAPQDHLPSTVFFSTSVRAPDSHKNNTFSTSFYLESESIIRVLAETSESPMILTLKQGNSVVQSDGSNSVRTPYIYALNAKLQQHSTYKLEVSYFPTSVSCHVYSLLIEIVPVNRIVTDSKCAEIIPKEDIVNERLLDYQDIFALISDSGFSTVINEPEYSYSQKNSEYFIKIPVAVTSESSLITGHLMSSFIKSGLVMLIEQDDSVIEWGSYKSQHRYELDPIPLSLGNYNLIIKEVTAPVLKTCVKYRASVLMEDITFRNDISAMIKKTETCGFPDQPETFNVQGQLDSSVFTLHQVLPIDTIFAQSIFELAIKEDSVFSITIIERYDINFQIKIYDIKTNEYLFSANNTLAGLIKPGEYFLEVLYFSDFGLPSQRLCPYFEMNLNVYTYSEYLKVSSENKCTTSQKIPEKLEETLSKHYMIFGKIDKYLKISVKENSEIDIYVGFSSIISGYVILQLFDLENRLIATSYGDENWSVLKTEVLAGDYWVRIFSNEAYEQKCWNLGLSYFATPKEICYGGILPDSLSVPSAKPYGGPQTEEGRISFHGSFKVDPKNLKDILKINAPEDLIVRILTISSGNFRIESAVYKENIFNTPIAYSNSKSKYGSFIFELSSQAEAYFLVLSHIVQNANECLLYDLKIVIEPKSSVGSLIECKLNDHKDLLPPLVLDFSNEKSIGSDTYAVLDKWMIGNNLPQGVTSSGKVNSRFVYEFKMKIPRKGKVSLQSNYDFLTNDLNFDVKNSESTVASSEWEIITDDELGETENFSSVIDEFEVESGTYEIVLKQGIASNHLLQRYPLEKVCFPFSFYVEFVPDETSSKNKILSVNPAHTTDHSALLKLLIYIKLETPIEVSPELFSMFYLKSGTSSVFPNDVSINPSTPSKLKLKFLENTLQTGTCYDLITASDFVMDNDIKHQFCTSPCLCNPKSKAECIDYKCFCPSPFTGNDCFDCITGYVSNGGLCNELVLVSDAEISSIVFEAGKKITKGQVLSIFIDFNAVVHGKNGEKLTKTNNADMINAFLLVNDRKEYKSYEAFPITENDYKWVLKFDSDQLEAGLNYKVEYKTGQIYSKKKAEFIDKSQKTSILVETKPKNPEVQSKNIEETPAPQVKNTNKDTSTTQIKNTIEETPTTQNRNPNKESSSTENKNREKPEAKNKNEETLKARIQNDDEESFESPIEEVVCSGRGYLYRNTCKCEKGYTGENCEKRENLVSNSEKDSKKAIKSLKSDASEETGFTYYFLFYALIFGLVIYAIKTLKKSRDHSEEFELRERSNKESQDIYLYD